MAELTQDQVTAIQGLTQNVDVAYRALQRSKTALSYLIIQGQATCNDVKNYNLMVQSTYYYQKSVTEIIKASGGSAPTVQPPLYVSYKGKTGDAAVNIDCSQGQINGWRPNGLGDFYLDPSAVEWKQEPTPSDNAAITKALAGIGKLQPPQNNGQLGNPLLLAVIPLILWGVIVGVAGYIVLKVVETLTDVPQKKEYTRQVAIAAEQHAATMEARKKCYEDCIARKKDPAECAKNCSRLNPEFTPPSPGFSLGIVGKIVAGVAAVGAVYVGVLAFRRWSENRAVAAGPQRHALGPGRAHADDDDDDDVIDAEYEER